MTLPTVLTQPVVTQYLEAGDGMLEPRMTPTPVATPIYYLDQIDVAVELPMGPPGLQGNPGNRWYVGAGSVPPAEGEYRDGDLYLGGDGRIYAWEGDHWEPTGVDLIPEANQVPPHDHDYLPLVGGTLTGPLHGIDARFEGNVEVPDPDQALEAVNLQTLNGAIDAIELEKFFGDEGGVAIDTSGSWNNASGQAIYQQVDGQATPPSVTGRQLGLVMHQASGFSTQLICDMARNMWFARTYISGSWGEWISLTPIVSTQAPVDPPTGTVVPHGTIWIQTDSAYATTADEVPATGEVAP